MKISSLAKYAIGITTSAALLAACSGGSSVNPGTMNAINAANTHVGHGAVINGVITTAWRAGDGIVHQPASPDKKKKKKAKGYQFLSDFDLGDVLSFQYPKHDSSTATITGLSSAQGMCSETGSKDYWVTTTEGATEFKAGSTKPVTSVSESTGDSAGCGVSDKGDLALSIISGGEVDVFKGGKGTPTTYEDGLEETFFTNFDSKGDLFVDGFTDEGGVGVAEMPAGKTTFSAITLSNTVEFPGNIQYDGKYVTVNDQEGFAVYQYTISGTTGTLEGTVSYSGAEDCDQDWIDGKLLICPNISDGLIYSYPKGGAALATLTGTMEETLGSTAAK